MRGLRLGILALLLAPVVLLASRAFGGGDQRGLDAQLMQRLQELGYTGRIASTLPSRLGRPLNPRLANIGRLLWFDTITGLNDDNTCAGCHSPTNGFGDSQPIAIGVDNNGIVGPDRSGPRNMRRAPMILNTAFYPELMWNSRFSAAVGRTLSTTPRGSRSRRRRVPRSPTSTTCSRRRHSSLRPSGPRWPVSTSRATTTRSEPRWCAG